MSKCVKCGNEILTGDIHWEMGLCNNCYNELYKDHKTHISLDKMWLKLAQDFRDENEKLQDKVADLEAKLALHEQSNKVLNDQLNKATEHISELNDKLAESEKFLKDNGFKDWKEVLDALAGKFTQIFDEKHEIWIKVVEDSTKCKKENETLKQQLAEHSKHHEWALQFLERYKIDPDSTPEYSENPIIEYCEQVYDFRLCDNVEIKDLQEQLAEYKKDNEQLEDRLHTAEQETLHFQNKCFDMQHKLAEKDKEIEELRFQARNIFPLVENLEDKVNQDKISFAVERLVNIQKYISDNAVYVEEECFGREINEYIDNQIEELKKEMK